MKPNGVKPKIDGPHYAHPCQCGHRPCKAWHVANVADVQGVSFTKAEAILVANVLNIVEFAAAGGRATTSQRDALNASLDAALDARGEND